MPQVELIRPIEVGPTGGSELTITNEGSNAAFYGTSATVSSTNKTGTLAVNESLTLTKGTVWLVAENTPVILNLRERVGTAIASGAAILGTDGTVGGPEGSPLSAAVVSVSHNINEAEGNIALGSTLGALTSGAGNTALGSAALAGVTSGKQNVALGNHALTVNTTGSENVAAGNVALGANLTGSQNIAIGEVALSTNTTGGKNIAIGNAALEKANASLNVAVGNTALQRTTSGVQNTAIGSTALQFNTTGERNAALGYEAAVENTTGSRNVALGYAALAQNATGGENVAIGANALGGPKETPGLAISKSVAIGFHAGEAGENVSGNIFIGYEAGAQEKGSNTLYIANSNTATPLIKGNFASKTLTITGRMEPGEAASAPAQGAENNKATMAETSAARKRSGVLNPSGGQTKFVVEHGLTSRLVVVSVQKGTAGTPTEVLGSAVISKIEATAPGVVEITFASAPAKGEVIFVTVIA